MRTIPQNSKESIHLQTQPQMRPISSSFIWPRRDTTVCKNVSIILKATSNSVLNIKSKVRRIPFLLLLHCSVILWAPGTNPKGSVLSEYWSIPLIGEEDLSFLFQPSPLSVPLDQPPQRVTNREFVPMVSGSHSDSSAIISPSWSLKDLFLPVSNHLFSFLTIVSFLFQSNRHLVRFKSVLITMHRRFGVLHFLPSLVSAWFGNIRISFQF